jgi:hypothetical protein
MYGICNDHVFYNGNKRTALVAMLAHLDRNNLMLSGTNQSELYDFMMKVASHSIGVRHDPRARRPQEELRHDVDKELELIIDWIDRRATAIARGERFITYRELRRLLSKFGYTLEEPKGNRIGIYTKREVVEGFLIRKKVTRNVRIGSIPWPGESKQMAINDIRYVRKICQLTEEDGCDSNSFYDYPTRVDEFINNYRKILKRLARV